MIQCSRKTNTGEVVIKILVYALFALISAFSFSAETVHFEYKPLTAGKASLAENSFIVTRTLGALNTSPELRLPVQLVYNSRNEKTGLFGFAWCSPQLESTAYYDKDGVLWTTPWGEKIKFSPKDEKVPKDALKLELYEEAKKGRGFYAPYSDWEAVHCGSEKRLLQSGDWKFVGKRGLVGWIFTYKDARLASIRAPTGRELAFVYEQDRLARIVQDGSAFAEFAYDGNLLVSVKLNGIEMRLSYQPQEVVIQPKTANGKTVRAMRPHLVSYRLADLNPIAFTYANGYLSRIAQGEAVENLRVDVKDVPGRLLSDRDYTYKYAGKNPSGVTLTDALGRTASYNLNQGTGVFRLTDFSGKSSTIYYFMRYDVAYLGKVRTIVDGRGRTLVSYRYDKLSGRPVRVRDRFENDINFTYDKNGNLSLVTRRAAEQDAPEPVTSFKHNADGLPTEIARLDENGNAVVKTTIRYSPTHEPISIDNGQTEQTIAYNKFGYPTSIRNVFGQTRTLKLDGFNRPVSSSDIYGVTTRYTYTRAGQIAKIERADGNDLLTSLAITYDKNGLPVSYTDQSGKTKRFERDAFGRVAKEFFPDNTVVEYTYNAVGQLHQVLDQNKHLITFDWSRFGLDQKTTATGQVTDYVHDQFGLLTEVVSKQDDKTDRHIRYEYDKYDRPIKITYLCGETETFTYDQLNRVVASTRGKTKARFKYDYFGRLVAKQDGKTLTTYAYNAYGQRTQRVTQRGKKTLTETKAYDRYGRLVTIKFDDKTIHYEYNYKNQLVKQIIDGIPIEFVYTPYGQLSEKILGGKNKPISTLSYYYKKDGTLYARTVDGAVQRYAYDKKGQLRKVLDNDDNIIEEYVYDPAGNILKKTVYGKTTTYEYDNANQLVSSTIGDKTTFYAYDAAGRLVKEGEKTYTYGYLDKVLSVEENGETLATFKYHVDGQLARVTRGGESESFLWDGLALIRRGKESFVNEPYVTGGNPILGSKRGVIFNDILGTTLGTKGAGDYAPVKMTAFGETEDKSAFFTGKPAVGELGYAFLFRNYRANLGKWQTADPLGYPDGWNNLAYVNNGVTESLDLWGTLRIQFYDLNNLDKAGEPRQIYTYNSLTTRDVNVGGVAGEFAYYPPRVFLNPNTKEVTIKINLELNIIAGCVPSDEVQYGEICEYRPHGASAVFSMHVREAVLAHEIGHAMVFFNNVIPRLRTELEKLKIDDGTRDSSSMVRVVRETLASIMNDEIANSNESANRETAASFDDTWKKLDDAGGWQRWIKIGFQE